MFRNYLIQIVWYQCRIQIIVIFFFFFGNHHQKINGRFFVCFVDARVWRWPAFGIRNEFWMPKKSVLLCYMKFSTPAAATESNHFLNVTLISPIQTAFHRSCNYMSIYKIQKENKIKKDFDTMSIVTFSLAIQSYG